MKPKIWKPYAAASLLATESPPDHWVTTASSASLPPLPFTELLSWQLPAFSLVSPSPPQRLFSCCHHWLQAALHGYWAHWLLASLPPAHLPSTWLLGSLLLSFLHHHRRYVRWMCMYREHLFFGGDLTPPCNFFFTNFRFFCNPGVWRKISFVSAWAGSAYLSIHRSACTWEIDIKMDLEFPRDNYM